MEKKKPRSTRPDELKAVYLLYGDEEYMMEESLCRLKAIFCESGGYAFNLEEFDALEDDVNTIIDSAESLGFGPGRKLVIARNVTRIKRNEQQKLISYVNNPNPQTVLVLIAQFPERNEANPSRILERVEKTPLFSAIREHGQVLKFSIRKSGKAGAVESWVMERFARKGKSIRLPAVKLLLERIGNNLRDLSSAIERICLYAESENEITTQHVESLTSPEAQKGIFELVDAVADRRRDIALYTLNRLIDQGDSPERILGFLLRQFRLISKVKVLSSRGESRELSDRLKVQPFVISKCLQQSKRFSTEKLRSVFTEFEKASAELHSTRYLPEKEYECHVIERLIVKLTS